MPGRPAVSQKLSFLAVAAVMLAGSAGPGLLAQQPEDAHQPSPAEQEDAAASPGAPRAAEAQLGADTVPQPGADTVPQPYAGEYLRFLPLSYPRLVRQTRANERFHLFGDRSDASYRDRDPLNGIDDARDSLLLRLGTRFAPILIQNTAAIPLDFKVFMEGQDAFPLHVDTWDIAGASDTLVRTDPIDFLGLEAAQVVGVWQTVQVSRVPLCPCQATNLRASLASRLGAMAWVLSWQASQ